MHILLYPSYTILVSDSISKLLANSVYPYCTDIWEYKTSDSSYFYVLWSYTCLLVCI